MNKRSKRSIWQATKVVREKSVFGYYRLCFLMEEVKASFERKRKGRKVFEALLQRKDPRQSDSFFNKKYASSNRLAKSQHSGAILGIAGTGPTANQR